MSLFGRLHAKLHRAGARGLLSDASLDTMQLSVVPATQSQGYGLGWWVEEDRFGYRSLLAQGGTDAATAWLRLLPSEGIVVVVLANKGVGFPGEVIDEVLAAMLPRYAVRRAARARQTGGTPAAPAVSSLDPTFVGAWTGIVRAESGDVPIAITVADSGAVRGKLGSRSGEIAGRARFSGTLFRIMIPGNLATADSSAGRLAFYLRFRDGC